MSFRQPRIIIAATGANRVIGTQNGMPWDVPEEYAQYLQFVRGNTVIMGRRSHEIFGADLEQTHQLVVSRSLTSVPGPWAEVARSLEAALTRAEAFGKPIFVAGGATIYKQALDQVDAMYLSEIKGDFSGSVFFPAFSPTDWELVEEREEPTFIFRHWRKAT